MTSYPRRFKTLELTIKCLLLQTITADAVNRRSRQPATELRRMTRSNLRVCYLVTNFPTLSQTFVRHEVEHHVRAGHSMRVISMFKQDAFAHLAPEIRSITMNVFDNRSLAPRLADALIVSGAFLMRPHWWPIVLGRTFANRRDRYRFIGLALAFSRCREGFDIIHCHFGVQGVYAAALRKLGLTKAKVVTTFHGYDLSRALRRHGRAYYRELFATGDLFLPISEYWKARMIESGCSPDRIIVHHMGVDCAALAFKERSPRPGEPARLISIGRLVDKKGHEFSFRALAALRRRRPDLRLAFDLVGDGPEMPRLKALAAQLDIGDFVTFWGGLSHDRTLALLDRAMIFVLSSITAADGDMEGIPVSLMEAMAMGLPVISTRYSGIPELVQDQVSGFLFEERDVAGVSQAMEMLISDPERRRTMGRAGRIRIEQEFDHAKLMARLSEYYRQVTARSCSA